MRLTGILLAVFPLGAQDEEIRELIRKLEHDDVAVREQAQKELVRRGEAALPLLRKTLADLEGRADRAETRIRAEAAVSEIELAVRARKVYWDPKTVTLEVRESPLGEVLQEIARQAGIRIDASTVDRDARVSLKAESAPLLKVLDELCRGREDRTYEYAGEGEIRFRKDRHPGAPASYSGPFRIRLVSLRLWRSTDFRDRRCSLTLSLQADCESYLKPLKPHLLEVERVEDDRGSVLEKGKEEDFAVPGRPPQVFVQAIAGAVNWMGDPAVQEFSFRKLSPEARSVTFRGTLRCVFPLDVREVTFDRLRAGETLEVAGCRIRIDPQESRIDRGEAKVRNVMIHFEPLGASGGAGAGGLEARLERDSLVGIDEDGEEHRGQFHPMGIGNLVIRAGGALAPGTEVLPKVSFQTIFPTLRAKGLKKIRFRFTDPVLEKAVPFRFEGIPLP